MGNQHRVAILLATFNGERFLDEQLSSILGQNHDQIDIFVSDDGSTHATHDILAAWAARWTKGSFQVARGPRNGFSENFRSLIAAVPDGYAGYCFADQDDFWLPEKVKRSLDAIRAQGSGPVVYGSRTQLVDQALRPIGLSPLFVRDKSFRNALVQSMAGGNTMMLNGPAFALLAESTRRTGFVTHDWWTYMIVTGCGGHALYDPEPSLLYRQHDANVVGKNSGLRASIRRVRGVASGQFRAWSSANIESLSACSDMLTPSSRTTLNLWIEAHTSGPPFGLVSLLKSQVYRQNVRGNAMLCLASIMGWL